MYNLTEIKSEDFKFVPLKDWKWKPKTNLEISKKDIKIFAGTITSRRVGIQTYYGPNF